MKDLALDTNSASRSLTIDLAPGPLIEKWCEPGVQEQILADIAELESGDREKMIWKAKLAGRSILLTSRLVALIPGTEVQHSVVADHGLEAVIRLSVTPAPLDYGTEAVLHVEYQLPGGSITRGLARLLGAAPELLLGRLLRRLKALAETGEIPTLTANPAARQP